MKLKGPYIAKYGVTNNVEEFIDYDNGIDCDSSQEKGPAVVVPLS